MTYRRTSPSPNPIPTIQGLNPDPYAIFRRFGGTHSSLWCTRPVSHDLNPRNQVGSSFERALVPSVTVVCPSSAAVVMMSVRVMRLVVLPIPHRVVPVVVTVGAWLRSACCQAFLRSTRHIPASRAEELKLSDSKGGNRHRNTCCNLCSLSRSRVFGLDEKRLAGSERDDQEQSHDEVVEDFESQGATSPLKRNAFLTPPFIFTSVPTGGSISSFRSCNRNRSQSRWIHCCCHLKTHRPWRYRRRWRLLAGSCWRACWSAAR